MYYLFDENGLLVSESNNKMSTGEGESKIDAIKLNLSASNLQKLKDGCTYIDGVISETPLFTENQVKAKLLRMKEIREAIIALGYTAELPSDPRIDDIIDTKKQTLTDEWNTIKAEVDSTYDATLIEDVINSLFG